MTSLSPIRILLLAICTTCLLLAPLGCGEDPAVTPTSTSVLTPSVTPTGEPEFIAILQPSAKLNKVLNRYGLEEIEYYEDMNLLHFTAPGKSADDIRANNHYENDFISLESNDLVALSDPINLIVTFVEFDWEEGDYASQDALKCLLLDVVHNAVSGSNTRIAIIDTGVDSKHPHLVDHLELINDPVLGLPDENAYSGQPSDYPAFGHGTLVAGVIATVAPGATLIPIRALNNEGTGTDLTVVRALQTAIDADADIINLSLRIEEEAEVVEVVLQNATSAGITIFAGAGNNTPGNEAIYPASSTHTIAVAATEGDVSTCTGLAEFSAYGSNVEFACVGVDVGNSVPGRQPGDAWVRHASGTSISCAVASAVYALMLDTENLRNPPPHAMVSLQQTALETVPPGAVLYGVMSPYNALGSDHIN